MLAMLTVLMPCSASAEPDITELEERIRALENSLSNIKNTRQAKTYVGLSGESVAPFAGLDILNEACRKTYSPQARICYSNEIINTTEPPITAGYGRVQPVVEHVLPRGDGGKHLWLIDVSGARGMNTLNCYAWQSNSNTHKSLVVDASTLSFDLSRCDSTFEAVACCE